MPLLREQTPGTTWPTPACAPWTFKVVAYENGEREVYDLRNDPEELANLKSQVERPG